MHAAPPVPHQRSLDELGTPLADVTFCVIDLETTGGSAARDMITEVGAVRLRGGRCEGTFQTLVDPGRAIPPGIVVLTGITDAMVVAAPRIEAVLASLVDFVGDAVIVGHNVRFDMGFLQAALARDGRPALTNTVVDTVGLARRLVRDEVPNCRLGTLAERFGLPHRPSHRALDDALATGDLLHLLLERAGRLGVTGLDDLRSLTGIAGSAHLGKLRLTERLPRTPGVYLFRDGGGRVLYVGKATNLRSRVRQYFAADDRRKVGPLLRETDRIDHKRCAHELEAAVLEVRLIHHLRPRFNRQFTNWERAVYLKLPVAERYPRLSIVREPRHDAALYLGPVPSRATAQAVIDAVHTVLPLRRCTSRPGRGRRSGPCIPAQLGVALCPCTGAVDQGAYRRVVETAVAGLTTDPDLLLGPLRARMAALAGQQRYEEAGLTRDRAAALAGVLDRQWAADRWRDAGRVVFGLPDGGGLVVDRGRLTQLWEATGEEQPALDRELAVRSVEATPGDPGPPHAGPLPRELADELGVVESWFHRHGSRATVVSSDAPLREPRRLAPEFRPPR